MLIENFLSEGRLAPLFHLMTCEKAEAVFEADAIEPRWEHDVPGLGRLTGTSMTRNARLKWGKTVRLHFDQSRLAQNHRIVPLDGEYVFRNTHGYGPIRDRVYHMDNHGSDPTWQEEFVIGTIRPLHKYLTGVTLWINWMTNPPHWQLIQMEQTAKNYCERFSIPLIVTEEYRAKVDRAIELANLDED